MDVTDTTDSSFLSLIVVPFLGWVPGEVEFEAEISERHTVISDVSVKPGGKEAGLGGVRRPM